VHVCCACVLCMCAVHVCCACVLCMCAVHVCCACVLCMCGVHVCCARVLIAWEGVMGVQKDVGGMGPGGGGHGCAKGC
jgi:hypothetical protein